MSEQPSESREHAIVHAQIVELRAADDDNAAAATTVVWQAMASSPAGGPARGRLLRGGRPPKFAQPGSVAVIVLDRLHIDAAPEPPSADDAERLQHAHDLWIWNWPREIPPSDRPDTPDAPAFSETSEPWGLDYEGIPPIPPPPFRDEAGQATAEVRRIADGICDAEGEPGSEEHDRCLDRLLIPAFDRDGEDDADAREVVGHWERWPDDGLEGAGG